MVRAGQVLRGSSLTIGFEGASVSNLCCVVGDHNVRANRSSQCKPEQQESALRVAWDPAQKLINTLRVWKIHSSKWFDGHLAHKRWSSQLEILFWQSNRQ